MQPVTIVAAMRGGALLVERAEEFGRFVDLVLAFRRDPDCLRLCWHVEPPSPPAQPPAATGRPARAFVVLY